MRKEDEEMTKRLVLAVERIADCLQFMAENGLLVKQDDEISPN